MAPHRVEVGAFCETVAEMHGDAGSEGGKLFDLAAQGMDGPAVAGVDEPDGTVAFPRQHIEHRDRRRQPDAAGKQHDGPAARRVQLEGAARQVDLDDGAGLDLVMQPARTHTRRHVLRRCGLTLHGDPIRALLAWGRGDRIVAQDMATLAIGNPYREELSGLERPPVLPVERGKSERRDGGAFACLRDDFEGAEARGRGVQHSGDPYSAAAWAGPACASAAIIWASLRRKRIGPTSIFRSRFGVCIFAIP